MTGPTSVSASHPGPRRRVSDRSHEPRAHLVVDRPVDDDAAGRRAALTRGAEGRPDDAVHGEVEVGVVHDDDPVLAAEFEVHVLEVLGGGLQHRDAGLARAGQRDHADIGMADDPVPHLAAEPVHEIDDAVGHAGLDEQLHEALPEHRRVVRGLEHHGVPAHECRDDLPGRNGDREVPRRDHADDADRLTDAHLELVGQLRRRRLAEETPALAGHVVAHVDRFLDVAARLREHLAHLARHQLRQLVLVLGEQRAEPEQDLTALRRGNEPPARVRLLRRLHSAIDVLGRRPRERADQIAVGGAPALEGLAGGIDPLAADEIAERLRARRHRASVTALRSVDRREGSRDAHAPPLTHPAGVGSARGRFPRSATPPPVDDDRDVGVVLVVRGELCEQLAFELRGNHAVDHASRSLRRPQYGVHPVASELLGCNSRHKPAGGVDVGVPVEIVRAELRRVEAAFDHLHGIGLVRAHAVSVPGDLPGDDDADVAGLRSAPLPRAASPGCASGRRSYAGGSCR